MANISKERNMFVAERFLSNVVIEYKNHPVATDGGTWCDAFVELCKGEILLTVVASLTVMLLYPLTDKYYSQ
jgi:hypothetical protein